jgi:hypothetical protein
MVGSAHEKKEQQNTVRDNHSEITGKACDSPKGDNLGSSPLLFQPRRVSVLSAKTSLFLESVQVIFG